jgi:hypothetical protein
VAEAPTFVLTGQDDEWTDVSNVPGYPALQNRRCPSVFRDSTGTYDTNGVVFREPNGTCFTNRASRVPVTFPYTPVTEYRDVPAARDR